MNQTQEDRPFILGTENETAHDHQEPVVIDVLSSPNVALKMRDNCAEQYLKCGASINILTRFRMENLITDISEVGSSTEIIEATLCICVFACRGPVTCYVCTCLCDLTVFFFLKIGVKLETNI